MLVRSDLISHTICNTTSCAGPGPACMCCDTVVVGSECSCTLVGFNQPKGNTWNSSAGHPTILTARIQCEYLTLTYRTDRGSAPAYLNAIIQIDSPSRLFCSSKRLLFSLPSLSSKRWKSRLFWFVRYLGGGMTYLVLSTSSDSLGSFKKHLNIIRLISCFVWGILYENNQCSDILNDHHKP